MTWGGPRPAVLVPVLAPTSFGSVAFSFNAIAIRPVAMAGLGPPYVESRYPHRSRA